MKKADKKAVQDAAQVAKIPVQDKIPLNLDQVQANGDATSEVSWNKNTGKFFFFLICFKVFYVILSIHKITLQGLSFKSLIKQSKKLHKITLDLYTRYNI